MDKHPLYGQSLEGVGLRQTLGGLALKRVKFEKGKFEERLIQKRGKFIWLLFITAGKFYYFIWEDVFQVDSINIPNIVIH